MKKKFAYLFPIGAKICWSGETPETLRNRVRRDPKEDQDAVEDFIAHAHPGYHIELTTGDFVFCTSES